MGFSCIDFIVSVDRIDADCGTYRVLSLVQEHWCSKHGSCLVSFNILHRTRSVDAAHSIDLTCMISGLAQLVISLIHSQPFPPITSFHKLTLPSAQLTARMLPAKDQETFQTASGNLGSVELPVEVVGIRGVEVQGEVGDGR